MPVTLTGRLSDVTSRPIEDISTVTVKAPSFRPGPGVEIITSQPRRVDLDADGQVQIDVSEGVGWLYIEGAGWSDSIRFVAAAGMKYLWEAVTNAAGDAFYTEYQKLLIRAQVAIDEIAQDAVNGAVDSEIHDAISRGNTDADLTPTTAPDYDAIKPGFYTAHKAFMETIGLPVGKVSSGLFSRIRLDLRGKGLMDTVMLQVEGEAQFFFRTRPGSSSTWQPWVRWGTNNKAVRVPAGADLDMYYGAEVNGKSFTIASYDRPSIINAPTSGYASSAAVMWVQAEGNIGRQFFTDYYNGGTADLWTRTINDFRSLGTSGAAWSPWTKIKTETDASTERDTTLVGTSRAVVEQSNRQTGGAIGTNGRGVIALRFDHHAKPFVEKVLPMLRERGLPASQCHFPGSHDGSTDYFDDNAGVDYGQIQRYSLDSGIEVWNHSYTHKDSYDMFHEIVDSKHELERRMPLTHVAGMMIPGIAGSNPWGGFYNRRNDYQALLDTEAGRLLQATHASFNLALGYGAVDMRLPVPTKMGWAYTTMDKKSDVSDIVAKAKAGYGQVIMLHANRLDEAGYITTSQWEDILDVIANARDAGEIEVLTVTGLLNADLGTDRRMNLLQNSHFESASAWKSDGFTIGGGQATSTGEAAISQSVRTPFEQGGVYVITADVEGTGSVSVGATGAGLSASNNWFVKGRKVLRKPIMVPMGTTSITVTVETNAAMKIHRLEALAA